MKKIKSPWYGVIWIGIWTAGLIWFLLSGMFDEKESIGLVLVYIILVGVTAYMLAQHFRVRKQRPAATIEAPTPSPPALNAPCPCGSGKKYKRCCGK